MGLVFLLLVPIIVCGAMFYFLKATITWKEFLLQFGVTVLLVVGAWFLAKWGALHDTENWHGRITGKPHGTEKCCHCQTICHSRNKDGTCTSSQEICSHAYDYWWALDTNIGRIGVEGCSGWNDPPTAWTQARIGEPAVKESGYKNYLLADPDSLIRHDEHGKFLANVPEYPGVHSYYRKQSVISHGVFVPPKWAQFMSETNADLGKKKQVDITVLLTKIQDPTYAQAVEAKWLYGPKNSMTVVVGVSEEQKASWARVVTISKVEELKVHLRDEIQGKSIDSLEIPQLIRSTVENKFKRTPMAEYEYLAQGMTPKGWWLFGLYALAFIVSIVLGIVMHKKDVFGDERRARWKRMYS
jgi:hypothetical protein